MDGSAAPCGARGVRVRRARGDREGRVEREGGGGGEGAVEGEHVRGRARERGGGVAALYDKHGRNSTHALIDR